MILRNGNIFNPYSSFEDSGINYPSNWYFFATQDEKDTLGFTEVPDPVYPDLRFYDINGGVPQLKPLELCKEVIKNELANTRWLQETAGIVFNNIFYVTDSQSRVSYLGALQRSLLDPNYVVNWKAKTELDPLSSVFVTLSAPEMVVIANLCITYVTECFEQENKLLLEIDNATTLDALTGINIQAGWPERYYN
jgi:hypothetical protein